MSATQTTPPSEAVQRIMAYLIDAIFASGLIWLTPMMGSVIGLGSLFYVFGVILGLGYVLTKDALPFLDGRSIGKKVIGLKVIHSTSGQPITNDYKASALRSLSLLIPFLNLYEVFLLLTRTDGKRLGDEWAETKVITQK